MSTKKDFGDYGESLACKYLKENGYKIIKRNYETKIGEVDIIALETKKARKLRKEEYKTMSRKIKRENVLVFIEVKSRSSLEYGNPSDAVDFSKQNKYLLMAATYIQGLRKSKQYRLDIIEVFRDSTLNHIRNAF